MQDSTPLRDFIVHIPNPYNETITHGTLSLSVVTKFNQHDYRSRTGIVKQVPLNCSYPIKKGDTLYIDYMVVEDQSEQYIIDRENNLYKVPYTREHDTLNNFAYAYENETGVHMINDWCFLEPLEIEAKEEITSGGIIIPEMIQQAEEKTRTADMGILRYARPDILEDLDLEIGDIVQFHPFSGWDTQVDRKDMRMAQIEDILMVIPTYEGS